MTSAAFRTAWITGAGKGIGRALALALAGHGTSVAISARSTDDLAELAAAAEGLPGRVFAVPLDVTDPAGTAAAYTAIQRDLGDVDLVVLNAGTHIPMGAADFSVETLRNLVEVNLLGVGNGLAVVLPDMIARGAGHVAVTASVSGYTGLPTAAAYGATKAAVINMCEALKPELDRHGVRISVINPGFVKTPLTDRNTFRMPFLITAEQAAQYTVKGLRKGRFEIHYPWQFTMWLKLARLLPYGLYFALARRMLPKDGAAR